MPKEHVSELFSAQKNKVVATFWWDGEKVCCDNSDYLHSATERSPNNKTPKDGIEFLEALPSAYRNGYLSIRQK